MVERLNRTIEEMLSKVFRDQKEFDQYVPFVMMAYISLVRETTGELPYLLMLGTEARLPIDLIYGQPKNIPKDDTIPEFIERVMATIEKSS